MSAERRRRRRAQGGFTLLEALVAMVVLALVAGAALPIIAGGLRSLGTAEDHQHGMQLARFLLEEAVTLGPGDRVEAGVSPEGAHWRRTISTPAWWHAPDRVDAGVQPLQVEVEVYWSGGGAERRIELRSVRPVRSSR